MTYSIGRSASTNHYPQERLPIWHIQQRPTGRPHAAYQPDHDIQNTILNCRRTMSYNQKKRMIIGRWCSPCH